MPSERVYRALKSKTDLSDEIILALSESEAWKLLYSIKPKVDNRYEICFSGFNASTKKALESLASAGPYKVVGSVTKNLEFLVAGENAGPEKLKKAEAQGVTVLTEEEFHKLAEYGELPA